MRGYDKGFYGNKRKTSQKRIREIERSKLIYGIKFLLEISQTRNRFTIPLVIFSKEMEYYFQLYILLMAGV